MSAFAGSGRSPSACTTTCLSSTRTPHSSAVADVVVPVLELEAEHVLHGAADHVEVAQPGELAGAAAGADQPALLVEDEERGVGSRVVVVEQLEQEAEPAALAALRAALEAGGALEESLRFPQLGQMKIGMRG